MEKCWIVIYLYNLKKKSGIVIIWPSGLLISYTFKLMYFSLHSVLIHNKEERIKHTQIFFFFLMRSVFFFFRDLLLPDGNRVSAFSVASTAIAAAQWSSSQVRIISLKLSLSISAAWEAYKPIFHFSASAELRGNVRIQLHARGLPSNVTGKYKKRKANKGWGLTKLVALNCVAMTHGCACISCPWEQGTAEKPPPYVINPCLQTSNITKLNVNSNTLFVYTSFDDVKQLL